MILLFVFTQHDYYKKVINSKYGTERHLVFKNSFHNNMSNIQIIAVLWPANKYDQMLIFHDMAPMTHSFLYWTCLYTVWLLIRTHMVFNIFLYLFSFLTKQSYYCQLVGIYKGESFLDGDLIGYSINLKTKIFRKITNKYIWENK